MKALRFLMALWAGKLCLWLWKLTGNERDDRPGMASMRLCEDFLARVAKPKLTIVVTGTNGKTTISSMLAGMLRMQGMTVAHNDWGANHHAGQARCLLDAVNIFNRPTKDAAVIEADELISPLNVPRIRPNYLIINNLARDSMLRNAHPDYIREHLERAAASSPDSVVILNADDPISCFLGEKNRRLYFGVSDRKVPQSAHNIDDFAVCPVCGTVPRYNYRNSRHIGDFVCPSCGLHSPNRDFFVETVSADGRQMTVRQPNGVFTYPLVSSSLHNIYNTVTLVTLFSDMGTAPDEIAALLSGVQLPPSRETRETVEGIELVTHVAKGQNATAVSTVFESVAADPEAKELIMLLDEVFENPTKTETIVWIYDTDYEFLKHDSIRRIVCGGDRYLDHMLRLKLAGVPEEKIVCVRDPMETYRYVSFDGVKRIYVLHDVNSVTRGRRVRDAVKARILEERGEQHGA